MDLRHLAAAIAIDATISVAAYFLASRIFAALITVTAVAHAYAMLGGLVGCIIGGVVCATLFKPKREFVREEDDGWRFEALQRLESERGTLGQTRDLLPATEREMRELGLLDAFERHGARHTDPLRDRGA